MKNLFMFVVWFLAFFIGLFVTFAVVLDILSPILFPNINRSRAFELGQLSVLPVFLLSFVLALVGTRKGVLH